MILISRFLEQINNFLREALSTKVLFYGTVFLMKHEAKTPQLNYSFNEQGSNPNLYVVLLTEISINLPKMMHRLRACRHIG